MNTTQQTTRPTWLLLTFAGWLAAAVLALSIGAPSDSGESPSFDGQGTPVKAYPG